MKLSELLQGIQVLNPYEDMEIKEIASDSRRLAPGDLFVCIIGGSFDGHDAAAEMLEKGAAAIVVQRDLGLRNQILVEDTRSIWGPMCANFFGNPGNQLRLIGLTGTNGKTTTSFLIKQILESTGKKTGLIGTVQNMVGDEVLPAKFTTPEPYELQRLFRQMVDAGCVFCVMEVSSQALAQGRVRGCHFEVAGFTNLTQDHLDYHKTWENYFEAKRQLFADCEKAVINVDDENGLKMVEGLDCEILTYAVNTDDSDYTAKNVKLKPGGIAYELVCKHAIGRVVCPVPGRFSVYNSLCAAVCTLAVGVEFQTVLMALANTTGVKGRIEVVPTNTEYTLIIDYAHSPDGLRNIITALREVARGRIITVFGCGGDRDKAKRPIMGRIAAELSDFLVVTSDNPRSEDPHTIIEEILTGVKEKHTPYEVVEQRRDGIRYAMTHAQKDDIIILAGKGHETYQILPTGTIHFDEREVVAEILANENNNN